jgi:polynucleotide 5'-kinase involved in rRNA processing
METSGDTSSTAPAAAQPPPAPVDASEQQQKPANIYEQAAADPSAPKVYPKPVTMLVIGMAGSGKTTLMQVRLTPCCLNCCLWIWELIS